jgi:mannose-1-phosphate guanylyltransferase/phosphomannomutase
MLNNQAVILCGGRGERLRPLTDTLPKPLAPVAGRPFVAHLLEQLRDNGYREAVLLTGYRGQMIAESLGDGLRFGIRLTYRDGPEEWQTAKRLWEARQALQPHFLLLYGDNYATFQHDRVERVFRDHGRLGCLTVHPRSTRANVAVTEAGEVTAYDPRRTVPGLNAVEIGYALLSSRIFDFFTDANESFSAVVERLATAGQLSAFIQPDAYQSISDLDRLAVADAYFTAKKILLIDRDGTINRKPERARYISSWDEWRFVPETLAALKQLAAAGWSFAVISNQAGVARGMVTQQRVHEIDRQMKEALDREGVRILGSYYCFHHWDDHCLCRKPEPGMFHAAARDLGLRLDRTWYLGDDPRDCTAAWRAGCQCAYIGPPAELESLPAEERPAAVFSHAGEFAARLLEE